MSTSSQRRPAVSNAVLWKEHGELLSQVHISLEGSTDGVTLTFRKGRERYDVFMTAGEARRLTWALHRAAMDALAAGAEQ